jgi:cytochrome bd-type quinol oxidase subunit 2
MYILLKDNVHHWMPFLWLLLMLVVLVQNFLVWKSDREFDASLQRQNKITLILTHIQVTVGLIMLALAITDEMIPDMATLMGNEVLRFKFVEHPTTMLLGAVLITVGNAKSKRAESGQEKAKAVVVWFGIGLALIALRFPWEAFLQGA